MKKKKPPEMKDYDRTICKMAKTLVNDINEGLPKLKGKRSNNGIWISAYYDSRWSVDLSCRIAKIRITLQKGNAVGVDSSDELESLAREIGAMKDGLFPENWYGLKVIVTPDAKFTVEHDKNPDCSDDPHWYES